MNTTYQIRLDSAEKTASFRVFEELGMTPADGIRIFLRQVAKTKSIPFAIKIPNAETRRAMEDARLGRNMTEATPDNLFDV